MTLERCGSVLTYDVRARGLLFAGVHLHGRLIRPLGRSVERLQKPRVK